MDQEFVTDFMDAAVRHRLLAVGSGTEEHILHVYLADPEGSGHVQAMCFLDDDAALMEFADTHGCVLLSDDEGDPFDFSSPSDLLDLLQCEADGFNLFAVCPDHGSIVACSVALEVLEGL